VASSGPFNAATVIQIKWEANKLSEWRVVEQNTTSIVSVQRRV